MLVVFFSYTPDITPKFDTIFRIWDNSVTLFIIIIIIVIIIIISSSSSSSSSSSDIIIIIIIIIIIFIIILKEIIFHRNPCSWFRFYLRRLSPVLSVMIYRRIFWFYNFSQKILIIF